MKQKTAVADNKNMYSLHRIKTSLPDSFWFSGNVDPKPDARIEVMGLKNRIISAHQYPHGKRQKSPSDMPKLTKNPVFSVGFRHAAIPIHHPYCIRHSADAMLFSSTFRMKLAASPRIARDYADVLPQFGFPVL